MAGKEVPVFTLPPQTQQKQQVNNYVGKRVTPGELQGTYNTEAAKPRSAQTPRMVRRKA